MRIPMSKFNFRRGSFLVAAGALVLSSALPASVATAAPGAKPGKGHRGPGMGGPGMGGPGGRGFGGRRPDVFKMLAEKLKLTPAQQKKIKPIIEKNMKDRRAIFENPNLSREQKKPKLDALRANARKQVDAILTPAQRATRKKMDDERRKNWGGGGMGGPGGGPGGPWGMRGGKGMQGRGGER